MTTVVVTVVEEVGDTTVTRFDSEQALAAVKELWSLVSSLVRFLRQIYYMDMMMASAMPISN
jgi:hypothetical protein